MMAHESAGWFAAGGFVFGTVTALAIVYLFLRLLDRTLAHRQDLEEDV